MNTGQKAAAAKVILYFRENSGVLNTFSISQYLAKSCDGEGISNDRNMLAIIGGLEDLNLIKQIEESTYRLKESGWEFTSFKRLRFISFINKAKENISFILNIILIVATIYITTVNDGLSKYNSTLKENIVELKARLLILETQIYCPHPEPEILDKEQKK